MIELVVVVMILGILAATALPKFMNVTEQAHEAAVAGAGGGLGSAVALAHAQWVANGHTTTVDNLVGFGDDTVDMSANGWPTDTLGSNTITTSTGDCGNVWRGVLQNPPSAGTAGTEDFAITAVAGVCTFTYSNGGTMTIAYDTANGSVVVDSVF